MYIYPYILLLITLSFSNCLLFKLTSSEPRCLGGEFNEKSVVILKYKLFTHTRKAISKVYPYLSIYFQNVQNKKKYQEEHIFINKGKFTFNTIEAGLYEICIQVKRYSVISELKEDLYVNFKINTDYNEDENLITDPIKANDVNSFTQKARQALILTKPILHNQKMQLNDENEFSTQTLTNANFYKYLTYIQVGVTFIIGIVQICNFKRFLKSLHVI